MRVQLETGPWQRAIETLGGKNALKVAVRALNRTMKSSLSSGVKLAAADIRLPQKRIRERVTTTIAKASGHAPSATLYGSTKRFGVIEWARGPEPSRGVGAVRSRMPKGKGQLPGAFIATMSSGHRGVFKRADEGKRKSRGAWGPNLPMVELKGPSVAEVLTKHREVMAARAVEVLAKNFAHEFQFLLSKLTT